MRYLLKIMLSAIAIIILAYIIPGIAVANITTALIVAVVLGILNNFVKPILQILSLPLTIITLGLFLLVINIFMVKISDSLIDGFHVSGWFTALLFSFGLSITQSALYSLLPNKNTKKRQ